LHGKLIDNTLTDGIRPTRDYSARERSVLSGSVVFKTNFSAGPR